MAHVNYSHPEKLWVRPKNLEYVHSSHVDPLFYKLISLCTPYGEEQWIVNVIQKLSYVKGLRQEILGGNLLIWTTDKPTTMFSAHMDIVGEVTKLNKEKELIDLIFLMESPTNPQYYFGAKAFPGEEREFKPSTLGADDKVGCFILCKMIKAKIPGLYVFHVGEERGGIGSAFLAKEHKDIFVDIKRAIAYDRAGYTDIIGTQRGCKCCSKKFGEALAAKLNEFTPPYTKFKSDITGSFTDTASYMDIIPECTNISAGYFNQHGENENVDYLWLEQHLLPIALKIDYESLPTERDPKKIEPKYDYGHYDYETHAWVGGSNHYSNFKRTTWKTATESTFVTDLPLWTPKIGYVEEANKKVLIKAIKHHLQMSSFQDKENIAKYIFDLMETNIILQEELDVSKIKIAKEPNGELFDIVVQKRKDLLQRLAAETLLVTPEDQQLPRNYAKGAIKWVVKNNHKVLQKQFSNKDNKKFNRMLFNMAFWLSKRTGNNNTTIQLLNECCDYVQQHHTEGGLVELGVASMEINDPVNDIAVG